MTDDEVKGKAVISLSGVAVTVGLLQRAMLEEIEPGVLNADQMAYLGAARVCMLHARLIFVAIAHDVEKGTNALADIGPWPGAVQQE